MPDPNIPEFQVPQEGVPSAQNAADAFSRIATSVERHADAADKINEALKRIPSHADEITRKFANVNLELKAMVELADDTEEAVKLINSQAKSLRKGIIDTKSAKDAHHILESIVSTQKIIQERVKKGSQNWAQSVKIVKELEAVMGKIRKEGELTTEEIETLNKAMLEAEKTGERMAKNFKAVSLNHITRQSVAIQRAWASMGVGKGMAARVEKYVGFADVAQKLKDAQKARIQENREAFRRRREEALAAVQEQFGEDMASPAAQASFLKKMGIRRGRVAPADMDYLMGKPGAAKTAAVEAMEQHGTGMVGQVFSKYAGGLEDALGSLGGLISELGPIFAALETAVLALIMVFDKYTMQNKKIEEGIAKGGLFATGEGARGFTGVRAALTPENMLYSTLGLTFERNLRIAQAIAEGGGNIQELVTGGRRMQDIGGAWTRGPRGVGTEFGPGSFGEIQRAVVGAGRIAGLTDVEGVQQILKMMNEYRTTLEYSEEFFAKVTKATNAAGISTTKYIQILDEVLSRFGRMNKSMDQAVMVLGEMSKTGRLASEDLKDYFDFITGGAGAKEATGTAQQMFLYGQMTPEERQQEASRREKVFTNLLTTAKSPEGTRGAFFGLGISDAELERGLGAGRTNEERQRFLTGLTARIEQSQLDPTAKKSMNNMVEQLRKRAQDSQLFQDFAAGRVNEVGMGFAAQVGGADMLNSMMMQRTAIHQALRESGTMADFIANPEKFAAQNPQMVAIAKAMGVPAESLGTAMAGTQRVAAGLRIEEAGKDSVKADKLITQLLSNPHSAKLIKEFRAQGMSNMEIFTKHGDDLREDVAGLEGTMDYWEEAAVKQTQRMSEKDRQDELDKARGVAKQTQSMADIVANAFSMWFNRIISGIEFIVDHWPFGGGKRTLQADTQKLVADKIDQLGTDITKKQAESDDLRVKGDTAGADAADAQIATMKKQAEDLGVIKAQGAAYTSGQKDLLDSVERDAKQRQVAIARAAELAKPGFETERVMAIEPKTGMQYDTGELRVTGLRTAVAPTAADAERLMKSMPSTQVTTNIQVTNVESPVVPNNGVSQSDDNQPNNSAKRPVNP